MGQPLFDIDDSAQNAERSSYDVVGRNSEGAEVVSEVANTKLYKRESVYVSPTGHLVDYGSYQQVGVLNYNNGIGFLYSSAMDVLSSKSVIVVSQEIVYDKSIEIDIEGEFFTRSENESGWFQETVGVILPKSPTKYITGVIVYDEDGDPMMIGKFPQPMKKTIYDDMRIMLKV